MPHYQEATDASILSADGLAEFAERRRVDEQEGFEGMSGGEGRACDGTNTAEEGKAWPPPVSAPAQYRLYTTSSPPPSAPTLFSHPFASFPIAQSHPLSSPSGGFPSSHPYLPSALAHPSPSFPSSGSTPSDSHGLPASFRHSPSWHSGSVGAEGPSGGARPPARQEWDIPNPYFPPPTRSRDPFEDGYEAGDLGGGGAGRWGPEEQEEEDEENYNGKGDYQHAAGTYQHGIGFDSHGGDRPIERPLIERRRERLERKFGVSPSSASPTSPSFPSRSSKFSFAAATAAQNKQMQDFQERSGVDEKGRLVVEKGGKKRKAARWAEGLGAVIVGMGSIGSAFTHPDPVPPPSGSAPLIALYLLPFLSLGITLYLHVIRPALFKRRRVRQPPSGFSEGGGMVVPLLQGDMGGMTGSGGGCCGRRREKRVPRGMMGMAGMSGMNGPGKYQPQQHGTTVNLVVDPSMFPALGMSKTPADEVRERQKRKRRTKKEQRRREQRKRRHGEAGGALDESLVSSSSSISSFSSSDSEVDADPSNPYSRKSILSSPLALEPLFLGARSWARKVALTEMLSGSVWAGVGAWGIGWSGKCKPGSGSGFCHELNIDGRGIYSDLYNLALAFAILTSLTFFTSATFGFIDLARTKGKNPRWRQAKAPGGANEGLV
ncbi:hypothetical protein JCM11251_003277 [Rhodosporidiobolus azoricus]